MLGLGPAGILKIICTQFSLWDCGKPSQTLPPNPTPQPYPPTLPPNPTPQPYPPTLPPNPTPQPYPQPYPH